MKLAEQYLTMSEDKKWDEKGYTWMGLIGNEGPQKSRQYYGLLMSDENIRNRNKDDKFYKELSKKSGLSLNFLKRFYELYAQNV